MGHLRGIIDYNINNANTFALILQKKTCVRVFFNYFLKINKTLALGLSLVICFLFKRNNGLFCTVYLYIHIGTLHNNIIIIIRNNTGVFVGQVKSVRRRLSYSSVPAVASHPLSRLRNRWRRVSAAQRARGEYKRTYIKFIKTRPVKSSGDSGVGERECTKTGRRRKFNFHKPA